MNRTDRMYAIAEELRRAGARGRTAARLAALLEVSTRTVKRDVSALQQAGTPIWAQAGPGGGYVLDASATLPPVNFTSAQAVAVAVALATRPPGGPFGADGATALGKVLDALGPADRARTLELASRVWVNRGEPDAPTPDAVMHALERSLAEARVVTITYAAPERTTRRAVEPVILARTRSHWWLVAWCREREALRWFRLDRVRRADLGTERYARRPVADVGEPPPGATPVVG